MVRTLFRSRFVLLLLVLLAVPAFASYYAPGWPCHAERLTYYSDATYSVVVGEDRIACYDGRYRWGQATNYSIYQYEGACCNECLPGGVCGIDP